MTNPYRVTNSGRPPVDGEHVPAPDMSTLPDGQHRDHWVLDEAERAKGFVRPVRNAYKHVGPLGPKYPTRPLTDEEKQTTGEAGYVLFEPYPESESPKTGRYWTQAQLDAAGRGCGVVTTMPQNIAETYARDPRFYGSTFCCGCGKYLPVGEQGEFVWRGTNERVGT